MSYNKDVKRIIEVYKGMLARCHNKNHYGYKYYGAKGIDVLVSRKDFISWYLKNVTDEMIRPSVDRIKSYKNYELSNMQILPFSDNARKARREQREKKANTK